MSTATRESLKRLTLSAAAAVFLVSAGAVFAQTSKTYELDIDAQDLGAAIMQYGVQTGNEVLFRDSDVQGLQTDGVRGRFTADEAIRKLLDNTGVPFRRNTDGTLIVGRTAISRADGAEKSAAKPGEPAEQETTITIDKRRDPGVTESEEEAKALRGLLDVIVVTGSRNVGVRRFEDDVQPYIIFNSEDIRSSFAGNLEEFFRTRLPQNTASGTTQQFSNSLGEIGNTSSVNLRGLGAAQTLILVNGRRAVRVSANLGSESNGGFNFQQADINGIPLASVERIEVLPATASGIYGGGATGGVINIITRRDFRGGEVELQYGNTFETDFSEYRLDASYGFAMEDGRTKVLLTASYKGSGELLAGERDFGRDSLNLLLANNPHEYFNQPTPPLGATPNIRSSFGNLILDDGTDLGSNITFVPAAYSGVAADGGRALVANAGRFNTDPAQDLNGNLRPIRQSPEVYSFSASVRRDFTDNLELYLDSAFSSNEGQRVVATTSPRLGMRGDAPGNPFQGFVSVNYPVPGASFETSVTQESLAVIGGGAYQLPKDWIITADYNWSRARTEQIGTSPGFDNFFGIRPAIDAGRLNIFRDTQAFPLDLSSFALVSPNNIIGPRDSVLNNFALRASGPAVALPAGSVNVSALIETRDETLEDYYIDGYNFLSGVPGSLNTDYVPSRGQSTDSAYLELLAPIFSAASDVPLVQALDLQISGRYDDYSTKSPAAFSQFRVAARGELPLDPIATDRNDFDAFNYTLGLRYELSDDFLLRASYGTGFLPPSVGQIFRERRSDFFIVGEDPKRNGERIFVRGEVFFGGNPDLKPEESKSWSFGAILTPRALPDFRLSLDYSLIEKTDEILFANNQLILDNENALPGRVVRAELTPEDIAAGFKAGRVIGIDRSLLNFANTESQALDIQIDQFIETDRYGDFRVYAVATKMLRVAQQFTAMSDAVDRVGFDNGPLEWRANFGLTWTSPRRVWMLGWNAQHYDRYRVYGADSSDLMIRQAVLRQGAETIPSETYHDFFIEFDLDALHATTSDLFAGLEMRIGIQNVFDKAPATRAGFSPADGRFSVYGDNRLRRFTVNLSKRF